MVQSPASGPRKGGLIKAISQVEGVEDPLNHQCKIYSIDCLAERKSAPGKYLPVYSLVSLSMDQYQAVTEAMETNCFIYFFEQEYKANQALLFVTITPLTEKEIKDAVRTRQIIRRSPYY